MTTITSYNLDSDDYVICVPCCKEASDFLRTIFESIKLDPMTKGLIRDDCRLYIFLCSFFVVVVISKRYILLMVAAALVVLFFSISLRQIVGL